MEDTSEQILEHLAGYLYEPGERARITHGNIEVEIIDYHGDGLYSVRRRTFWNALEDDVIVYPGKDLTPIK